MFNTPDFKSILNQATTALVGISVSLALFGNTHATFAKGFEDIGSTFASKSDGQPNPFTDKVSGALRIHAELTGANSTPVAPSAVKALPAATPSSTPTPIKFASAAPEQPKTMHGKQSGPAFRV